jgi:propane monooxygenase coupling protein
MTEQEYPWGVPYEHVGIVMQRTPEGEAVARVLAAQPGVEIFEGHTYLDIRAKDRLVINFDDVSEDLGFDVDGYWLQTQMTTHYGRLMLTDDAFVLIADPLEVWKELGGAPLVDPQAR